MSDFTYGKDETMKSYFERLVNSIYASDNESFDNGDTIIMSAYDMLDNALDLQNQSMFMFKVYQTNDEEWAWTACMEYDKQAMGLLDAYRILTNREVLNTEYAILEEINWLIDTFPHVKECLNSRVKHFTGKSLEGTPEMTSVQFKDED